MKQKLTVSDLKKLYSHFKTIVDIDKNGITTADVRIELMEWLKEIGIANDRIVKLDESIRKYNIDN